MITAPNPDAAHVEHKERSADLLRLLTLVRETIATRKELAGVGFAVDDSELMRSLLVELGWYARRYQDSLTRLLRTINAREGEGTPSNLPRSSLKS